MQGNDRIYTSMGPKVFDMYKNSELYKSKRDSQGGRIPVDYTPVTNIATITVPADNKTKPTIDLKKYDNIRNSMKKYFGTNDSYAIYVPAAEQEFGSAKKPSTRANDKLTE